eukprot:CAMPEP_0172591670 /NCGR_PEP_ID=MMETSP1068-20121228/10512_1 /TAXON_ID=35684 /ORGANISM="Pseudopedinella elastica, Strain CCMP716" /LENGTH=44 /DNA_ID= /DNA_START= /DNA_END= /DNA_ORIENTATION=
MAKLWAGSREPTAERIRCTTASTEVASPAEEGMPTKGSPESVTT